MVKNTAMFYLQKLSETINRLEISGDYSVGGSTLEVDNSPTRRVSERFIINTLNDIQNLIVSSAKAIHIPDLIVRYTGDIDVFNSIRKNRVLHGRVWRKDETVPSTFGTLYSFCRYRDIAEHRKLESSNRQATALYPSYTYDDNVLTVYPFSSDLIIDYVKNPDELTSLSDTLEIDERFNGVINAYLTAQAYKQFREPELHNLWMKVFDRRFKGFNRRYRIGPSEEKLVGPIYHEEETEVE